VAAIISMVVLAVKLESQEQSGCEAAAGQDHSDSNITAFLVWCWMRSVVFGLRRAHAFLKERYDLSAVRSGHGRKGMAAEAAGYLSAITAGAIGDRPSSLAVFVMAYSKATGRFFLGNPSQQRTITGI